jgi:hypothetical protein
MDYKYIKQLLDRYWKGVTTLEEEEILRAFFSQEDVPAELKPYQTLFTYEQNEKKEDVLDDDFDQKIISIIEMEKKEGYKVRKPHILSITQSLKPLFKAAAVVAIFLTLGNAAQVAFNGDDDQSAADTAGTEQQLHQGASVAMGDSASEVMDSLQHSSIEQATPSATIIK